MPPVEAKIFYAQLPPEGFVGLLFTKEIEIELTRGNEHGMLFIKEMR